LTAASAAASHTFDPDSIDTIAEASLPSFAMTAWTTVLAPTFGTALEAGVFQTFATRSNVFFWYGSSVSVDWK